MKQSRKRYFCNECGHQVTHTTNHYGQTYSWGTFDVCPSCPPLKRPTTWQCMEEPPAGESIPPNWKTVTLTVKRGK